MARALFVCACFTVAAMILMTISTDFLKFGFRSLKIPAPQPVIDEKIHQVQTETKPFVLLLAYYRTGSSYTGSVLASYPGAFYLFEPLLAIKHVYIVRRNNTATFFNGTKVRITDSYLKLLRREELHALMTCNLEWYPYELAIDLLHWRKIRSLASLSNCSHGKTIQETHTCMRKIQKRCLTAPLRIIKFIRLRMPNVEELIEEYPHIKFIHLVRDPRGNALSQSARKKPGGIKNISSEYCHMVREDSLEKARIFQNYPDRIYTLRYESIANFPFKYATELLHFINKRFNLTKGMTQYIGKITLFGKAKTCPYCVERGNSSKTASKWRAVIGNDSFKDINEVCGSTLDMYGYTRFQNINDVRNLTIPSMI